MRRSLSLLATIQVLLLFCALYAACSLVPSFHDLAEVARYRYVHDGVQSIVLKAVAFYLPHTPPTALFFQMHAWEWLPQAVAFGLLAALLYLTARTLRGDIGFIRVALLAAGTTMLAMGIGDLTGMAIAFARGHSAPPAETPVQEQDLSATVIFMAIRDSWTSDALYAGIPLALCAATSFVGCYWAQQRLGAPSRTSYTPAPTPSAIKEVSQNLSSHSSTLATLGILPILILAFLGGLERFFGHRGSGPDSLINELGAVALYPRLRPTPPSEIEGMALYARLRPRPLPGTEDGALSSAHVPLESWLTQTFVAIFLLATLWLLLRLTIERLVLPRQRYASVFLSAWAVTILAGASASIIDALLTGQIVARMATPSPGPTGFILYLVEKVPTGMRVDPILPGGIRFGVLWGWLVGLLVLAGYQRIAQHQYQSDTPQ